MIALVILLFKNDTDWIAIQPSPNKTVSVSMDKNVSQYAFGLNVRADNSVSGIYWSPCVLGQQSPHLDEGLSNILL